MMVEGIAQFLCKVQKEKWGDGGYTQVSLHKKDTILNHTALNKTCAIGSHEVSIILDLMILASNSGCILQNLKFCT